MNLFKAPNMFAIVTCYLCCEMYGIASLDVY